MFFDCLIRGFDSSAKRNVIAKLQGQHLKVEPYKLFQILMPMYIFHYWA